MDTQTEINGHQFETKTIPHYTETWIQPAVKVVDRHIVLDPDRPGTVKYEVERWDVYRDGAYICTKRLTGGGCISSSEPVALAFPRLHDRPGS